MTNKKEAIILFPIYDKAFIVKRNFKLFKV